MSAEESLYKATKKLNILLIKIKHLSKFYPNVFYLSKFLFAFPRKRNLILTTHIRHLDNHWFLPRRNKNYLIAESVLLP